MATDRGPVLPVAMVDVRGVAEAVDAGDHDTAWWYDPSSGQVELGVSDWIDDEFGDEDPPEDRGHAAGVRRFHARVSPHTDRCRDFRT